MKYTAMVSWSILGKCGNYLPRGKTIRNIIAEDIQKASEIALQSILGISPVLNCIWADYPQN